MDYRYKSGMALLLLLVLSLTYYGCLKKDIDRLAGLHWGPEVAIPLVKSTVSVNDMLDKVDNDSLYVDVAEDNFVTLIYSSNVFSNRGDVVVEIPTQALDQSFAIPNLNIDDVTIMQAISLGQIANNLAEPERTTILSAHGTSSPFPPVPAQSVGSFPLGTATEFSQLDIASADLSLTIDNNFPVDITNLTINLIDDQTMNTVVTFAFPPIAPGGSSTQTQTVTNTNLSAQLSVDVTSIASNGSLTPVPVDTTDQMVATLLASNIVISGGSVDIPFQDNPFLDTVGFGYGRGERLDHLKVKAGELLFKNASSGISNDLRMRVEILNAYRSGGQTFSQEFNIGDSAAFDLTGYTFDFTQAATGPGDTTRGAIVAVNFSSQGNEVTFTNGASVDVEIRIRNLVIGYADGYLGQQVFNIDEDTVALNIYKNVKSGSVFFRNPTMEMSIRNSYGVPIRTRFPRLDAVLRAGGILGLDTTAISPLDFNYPPITSVGGFAETKVLLDTTNSNIREVIAGSPIEMIYALDVLSNQGNIDPSEINFVTDTSYFEVDVEVRLPLRGWIKDFVIEDTFDIDLGTFELLEYANFLVRTENTFPMEVMMQLSFLDSNEVLIDSLLAEPTELLVSGVTDGNGRITVPAVQQLNVPYPKERFETVVDARKLVVRAQFLSKDALTNRDVKIFAEYYVSVNLGIQAGIKIGNQ